MSDTTRTDHAAAIRGMTEGYILDGNGPFAQGGGLAGIRIHVDALAAERDALREYARMIEWHYMNALDDVDPVKRARHPKVGHVRRDHGVAEAMERGRH
jgi:hypothetical protein